VSGQAIYRRWRPQAFADVVGQEHVTRTLRNAVKVGRVGHGYLFTGPRGVAKTSTARILAKAINCLDPRDGEPCNACAMCRAIAEGTSYDVIEMDAASNGLVDNVRDLRQHVMTHPDQARRKVYILDEAHRMSAPAFDALLKTLEEPPEHVVFILVTSEPDRIPATIVSRCQRFDFRRLPQRGIVGRLLEICQAEGVAIDPAACDLIARAATGSMRDAQSVLDQLFALGGERITVEDVETVLGTAGTHAAAQLAEHVVRRDQAAGLRLIGKAIADGADPRQFCRDVTDYLRGLLLLKLGGADDQLDVSAETLAAMNALAKEADTGQLLRAVKLFGQADVGWRGTLLFQLPLELAFVESTLEDAARAEPKSPAAATKPLPDVPFRAQRGGPPDPGIPAAGAKPAAPTDPVPRRRAPREDDLSATAATRRVDPPSGPSPSLQEVRAAWPNVKRAIKAVNRRLEAFLNDVRPIGVEDEKLLLEARFAAHQQQVMKADQRDLIETEVERALGRRLSITCSVATTWAPDDEEEMDPRDTPVVRAAIQRGWRARLVSDEESAVE
jgi:DNA polymerase-3 subunit gamma/tau